MSQQSWNHGLIGAHQSNDLDLVSSSLPKQQRASLAMFEHACLLFPQPFLIPHFFCHF